VASPPRPPAVAGLFYPADPVACERDLRRALAAAPSVAVPPPAGAPVRAVLAPHAGWSFSGALAAAALGALVAEDPATVVLFGADHHGLRRDASLHPGPRWGTPLGPAEVDGEAARALAEAGVPSDPDAHGPEHSIEVLVPFLRVLLPGARILPVLAPPGADPVALGLRVHGVLAGLRRRAVAVGSTDLTHYGARYGFEPRGRGPEAHRWSREENDGAFLERAVALDPEGLLRSARERRNACGPGAAAAAAAFARAAGATRGALLGHATSAEVTGERDPDLWVGYAALAFVS